MADDTEVVDPRLINLSEEIYSKFGSPMMPPQQPVHDQWGWALNAGYQQQAAAYQQASYSQQAPSGWNHVPRYGHEYAQDYTEFQAYDYESFYQSQLRHQQVPTMGRPMHHQGGLHQVPTEEQNPISQALLKNIVSVTDQDEVVEHHRRRGHSGVMPQQSNGVIPQKQQQQRVAPQHLLAEAVEPEQDRESMRPSYSEMAKKPKARPESPPPKPSLMTFGSLLSLGAVGSGAMESLSPCASSIASTAVGKPRVVGVVSPLQSKSKEPVKKVPSLPSKSSPTEKLPAMSYTDELPEKMRNRRSESRLKEQQCVDHYSETLHHFSLADSIDLSGSENEDDDEEVVEDESQAGEERARRVTPKRQKKRQTKTRVTGTRAHERFGHVLWLLASAVYWFVSVITSAVKFCIGSLAHTIWMFGVTVGGFFVTAFNALSALCLRVKIPGLFRSHYPYGLARNISMPSSQEEAIKRLMQCRGTDAYTVLGLRQDSSDVDIANYYRRQTALLASTPSPLPGAEQALELLRLAYEALSTGERRQIYDRKLHNEGHSNSELHLKIRKLQHTIRQQFPSPDDWLPCDECGGCHRRTLTQRPRRQARYCGQCYLSHAAKDGELWAESYACTTFIKSTWSYYACMEGNVYEVSSWARCQQHRLKHLKANNHAVFYNIAPMASVSADPDRFSATKPRPTAAKVQELGSSRHRRRIKCPKR